MIDGMVEEIPSRYLEGITGVEVSPRTVPDPQRPGVFVMGECIALEVRDGADQPASRVALYHGSFRALAQERNDFDWRAEAWETLTHELRHHLEWRAQEQGLEEYDRAAQEGFARADDEPFDPVFYLDGEQLGPNTFQVEDDVFFDHVVRARPAAVEIEWQGRRYRVPVPDATLPLYLVVTGLSDPPPGDATVVDRKSVV